MKEADLLKRVTEMAVRFNWKVWHVPSPMRWTANGWVGAKEAAGLPDLVMIHEDPPRMIFAELKGDGGALAEKQIEFLRLARTVADNTFGAAVLDGDEWDTSVGKTGHFPRTLGVYAWSPVDEPIAEQILRTKVLL